MNWLKLSVDCAPEHVDALAELLDRFGAASVSVSQQAGSPRFGEGDEQGGYWDRNRVAALLPPDADLDILLACLRNRIGAENILAHEMLAIGDRDWVAAGHAGHGPVLVGDRLCICPGWAQPLSAQHVLFLDPGLAFGTGSHPTTQLCLEWLTRADVNDCAVIDYGCGSGILGIAAAALGACEVHAVDIDPLALEVTARNAARNHLRDRLRIIAAGDPTPPADLLLANILLQPLLGLARTLAALVRPGGNIVLSGILAVQVESCLVAYTPWFNMAAPEYRNEWAMLHGTRIAGV